MAVSLKQAKTDGQVPAWFGAIADPASEFAPTPLPIKSGAIPPGLRGRLYRNGPARLERNGVRVNHWFDGDGAVLGVYFTASGATGVYRYVQSAGYLDESAANCYLYGGYGTVAPGSIWTRWQKQVKNVANTSVMALPDRLLALWEGGHPHALDLDSLETLGSEQLGRLRAIDTYSAHPKYDLPRDRAANGSPGDIFNFGLVPGATGTLNLYRSDHQGQIQQQNAIDLTRLPLIHDFVLAGPYLVFCIPPLRLNPLPAVLGLSSPSDALIWQAKRGTEILVIDRATLEVIAWEEVEPWFQWHFGKGYVDETGQIVLEVVRYQDFTTNQRLAEIASGRLQTDAQGELWQIRLQPSTGQIVSQTCLLDQSCEFPVVATRVGESSIADAAQAATYLTVHRPGADPEAEIFGAIARFDALKQTLTVADAGENRYPSEPIYAPDQERAGQGWILTVVYDATTHRSEVWIYDADHLDMDPVCCLELPQVIPHSFHGTWVEARKVHGGSNVTES